MTTDNIRTKSVDCLQTQLSKGFSYETRSSTIMIDELHRIEKEEKELNTLNHRFATYLNKIINLGSININLRRQIDDIHQKYQKSIEEKEQTDHNLLEKQFHNIRQQLNIEKQKLTSFEIRLERADYDKKYYKNQIKFFSNSNQIQQQFDANLYELNLLKEQYEKQIKSLQLYKKQYDEYTTKLIQYTDEYNKIVFERMKIEHNLCTLQEELLFEREYNARCRQEFEYLVQLQYDLNDQLTKTEFQNIVKKIRQDYKKYNEIQLSELDLLYKNKFNLIKSDFHHEKKEDIKPLIKQNKFLQQKLKQLKYELQCITEQNQQEYEKLNNEYNQLEVQLPQFESSIQISRNNTIHLTSEINTYKCLLVNLVQKPKSKPIDMTVHFGNGIIWCRI